MDIYRQQTFKSYKIQKKKNQKNNKKPQNTNNCLQLTSVNLLMYLLFLLNSGTRIHTTTKKTEIVRVILKSDSFQCIYR